MSRIVYVHLANPGVAGGQKVAVRHVETLCELGFDAVVLADRGVETPPWFEHRAPVVRGQPPGPDDIVVVPEDGWQALSVIAGSAAGRVVVICQNPYYLASSRTMEFIAERPERFSTLLTVGPRHAALMRRLFPQAAVEMVRCFADERRFRPLEKAPCIAYAPRKRLLEAEAIRRLYHRLHGIPGLEWAALDKITESQMARALGRASLFLSLSRLESVGMTTLEAMACGCVCAGFTGVGGAEFATPDNGFWAPEDDCVAAADALAAAVDPRRSGGPRLAQMLEAGRETAAAWSHAVFRRELEAVWTRLAPDARRGG